jgi:hypothetical protein
MKKIVFLIFLFLLCSPQIIFAQENCQCYGGFPSTQAECISPCVFDPAYSTCQCNIDGNTTDLNACETDKQPVANSANFADFSCIYNNSGTSPNLPSGTSPNLPSGTSPNTDTGSSDQTYKLPNFLGTDDPNVVVGRVIKFIIGISGTAALLVFIYGGGLWLFSRGKDDMIGKGKKAMVSAVIGLIIIFSSYVLVRFIISAITFSS